MDHSIDIFDKLAEPSLPPPLLPSGKLNMAVSSEQWPEIRKREQERHLLRKELIRVEDIKNVGQIVHFERADNVGKVVFLRSKWGGHNNIARMEAVVDVIGHVFKIRRVV